MLQSKVRIRERDHLITFIKPNITDGVSNSDEVNSWSKLDTDPYDYARVTNRLGTEVVESDQVVHIRQSIFNIGYRNDITTKMRISHNSKVYDIISIAEQKDTRNSSLDIVGELNENFTWAET